MIAKYYGCGFVTPEELKDCTVLDLGCGSGRDVYIASQLVGEQGKVIGVDMTTEQINTAKEYQDYHTDKFGYETSNVVFYQGLIEQLDQIQELEDDSVDVIISNCVINLCPDKEAVLKSCHRVLKPCGELYFSDVYSNRRIPQELRDDEVLWGECLSGVLYWNDFHHLAKQCGFIDPRLVDDSIITVNNQKVQDMIYKGTIPRFESGWALDDHHYMETGKIFPVCGNTFNMLKETRFQTHFDFIGDFSTHYGIFDGCGTSIPYSSAGTSGNDAGKGGGGCC